MSLAQNHTCRHDDVHSDAWTDGYVRSFRAALLRTWARLPRRLHQVLKIWRTGCADALGSRSGRQVIANLKAYLAHQTTFISSLEARRIQVGLLPMDHTFHVISEQPSLLFNELARGTDASFVRTCSFVCGRTLVVVGSFADEKGLSTSDARVPGVCTVGISAASPDSMAQFDRFTAAALALTAEPPPSSGTPDAVVQINNLNRGAELPHRR